MGNNELLTLLRKAIGPQCDYLYTAIRGRRVLLNKDGEGFYVNEDGTFGDACRVEVGIIDGQPVTV